MAITAARPITGVRNAVRPTTVAMAAMDTTATRMGILGMRMAITATSAAITIIDTTAIVTAATVTTIVIGVVNATETTTGIDRFPVYRFL
jgi:hypothetical protein